VSHHTFAGLPLHIDVPRSDRASVQREPGRHLDIDSDSALQYSRKIQKHVFRQLGAQKDLRELHVGCYGTWIEQRNCLEMTIGCGLEELVGVKDLQVLDVGCLDHTFWRGGTGVDG